MKPSHVLEIVEEPELFFGTLMKNALSLVDDTWRPQFEDPWKVSTAVCCYGLGDD